MNICTWVQQLLRWHGHLCSQRQGFDRLALFMLSGLTLASAMQTQTVLADTNTLTFADFSATEGLNLNLYATQAGNVLRLVPEEIPPGKSGSAYLNCPITVDGNTSFYAKFRFRIWGGNGTGGADGLTFVFQNDPAGPYAAGETGPNVGYTPTAPSIAVELNGYQNYAALLQNGSFQSPLIVVDPTVDLNDGNAHWLWVDYEGTAKELSVYIGDDENLRPTDPLFSYAIDIPTALGGQAFFGFTAGTGGLSNIHDIESWVLQVVDSPQTVQKCAITPPVPNDEPAGATALEPFPFRHGIATTSATGMDGEGNCAGSTHSVWYRYTPPSDAQLQIAAVNEFGDQINVALSTGSPAALTQTACNPPDGKFTVRAGQTYYFMVGAQTWPNGGYLEVSADLLPPPPPPAANDDFANATVITHLPFGDTVDTTSATSVADPPCTNAKSVWYALTPKQNIRAIANTYGSTYYASISVWTKGKKKSDPLTQIGTCGGDSVAFEATANMTYYLMVGANNGDGGTLVFNVQEGLKLDVITNQTGTVQRSSGIATITGSIRCNEPAFIYNLGGTLFQRAGRFTAYRGDFQQYPYAQCLPLSPVTWSATITGNGPFNAGQAQVDAGVFGCGSECLSTQSVTTIRLKQR